MLLKKAKYFMICQNGTFLMLTAQTFYKMKQTTVEDLAGRGGGPSVFDQSKLWPAG